MGMRGKKASADNWYNADDVAGGSEDYGMPQGKRAGGQSKGFVGKIKHGVFVKQHNGKGYECK